MTPNKYLCADWRDEMSYLVWTSLAICDPFYADPDLGYIDALTDTLAPGGSLYIFSDASGVAQTKLACDANPDLIFQNWLIWGPNDWGGRSQKRWGQKHDDILFYTKRGAEHIFNGEAVGVPKLMVSPTFNPSGRDWKIPSSVWHDLGGFSTVAKERVKIDGKGSPWQKPEALIERIILASSNPGSLVLDPFSGVATIPVVCERLDRRYLATEINPVTHAAGLKRLSKCIDVDDSYRFRCN